jgi:sulfur-carrier protein adenylyltransferase/sulfurtransferase
MKWMQFFTPVSSITWEEANKLVADNHDGDVLLLDVRQPKEYEQGHMPGAKLIPIGDLEKRLAELDREKSIIVYCAIGGRSRIAAQMLAGKGFGKIYNLSGGIKAWKKEVAVGPEDTGLHLFAGGQTPEQAIITGFALEAGLRDFYLSMQKQVKHESTKSLFGMLADIEILHQERLVKLYVEVTGTAVSVADFAKKIAEPAMEGGLTTEQYLQLYKTDLESEMEVLGLALAIEVQALDLYSRAAEKSDHDGARRVLSQIADEERSHIARLSEYIDHSQDAG